MPQPVCAARAGIQGDQRSERELALVEHVLEGEFYGQVKNRETALQRHRLIGDGDWVRAAWEEQQNVGRIAGSREQVRAGYGGFVLPLEPATRFDFCQYAFVRIGRRLSRPGRLCGWHQRDAAQPNRVELRDGIRDIESTSEAHRFGALPSREDGELERLARVGLRRRRNRFPDGHAFGATGRDARSSVRHVCGGPPIVTIAGRWSLLCDFHPGGSL